MIDVKNETLVSLPGLAKKIPPPDGAKRTAPSTPFRWRKKGSRALDGTIVYLEAVLVGSRWMTSLEAFERFVARLNAGGQGQNTASTPRTPDGQFAAELDREAELVREKLGARSA